MPAQIPPTMTFPLWSKLPRELRSLVWYHAAHTPRNIHVAISIINSSTTSPSHKTQKVKSSSTNDSKPQEPYFLAITPVPSLLHATHESRTEGLRYYKLAFQQGPGEGNVETDSHRMIFINPSVDTLIVKTSRIGWHILSRLEMNALLLTASASPTHQIKNTAPLLASPWGRTGESIILANEYVKRGEEEERYLTFVIRSADSDGLEPSVLPKEVEREIVGAREKEISLQVGFVGSCADWNCFWERFMNHVLVGKVRGVGVMLISDDFMDVTGEGCRRLFK